MVNWKASGRIFHKYYLCIPLTDMIKTSFQYTIPTKYSEFVCFVKHYCINNSYIKSNQNDFYVLNTNPYEPKYIFMYKH
jgi:hypothetical protein